MLYAVCTQDIAAVVFLCYGFASVNRRTLYILEFRLKVILAGRIENTKKLYYRLETVPATISAKV